MSRFEMPEHCIEDLGRLIASIHHGGIDAPSLRLRSVVLRADGELGLDDLAHCRLYRGGTPLPEVDREENLRNLLSHADASLFEDRLRAAYRQSRPSA
jgi:hypothetical protein